MALQTDEQKIRHLLRRFGLGASVSEMEFYGTRGYRTAVDRLLEFEDRSEGYDLTVEDFRNRQNNALPPPIVQTAWMTRLGVTGYPLQQKLTLFWHDHFATSLMKVDKSAPLIQHVETLRKNGLGPFLTLLTEVSKDPAMLFWLDNCQNTKDKPNENFAREVMELFTLGIGHYEEEDIPEVARAFTGWTFSVQGPRLAPFRAATLPGRQLVFYYDRAQHDNGTKKILGKTANFDGDAVLKMLAEHPQTARHLVYKFWEFFVYPKPKDELVEEIAQAWRAKGMVIKDLVRIVALHPEFVSERAERALVKNPVDFIVPTLRALGVYNDPLREYQANTQRENAPVRLVAVSRLAQGSMSGMGMKLLEPPDVAGWLWGEAWISSATMVERVKWADRLFADRPSGGMNPSIGFQVFPLITRNPNPAGLVAAMVEWFDAELPAAKVKQLEEAARLACGERITPRNAQAGARAVARLIFGSPEFQMA